MTARCYSTLLIGRRKNMRQHSRRKRNLSLLGLCVVPVVEAASTGFPGTLPSLYTSNQNIIQSSSEIARAGASSDDDEYFLDESSDFEEEETEEKSNEFENGGGIDVVEKEVSKNSQRVPMQGFGSDPREYSDAPSVDVAESESESSSFESHASSSQPLKTLQKLQHMLDSTDYMTVSPSFPANANGPLFETETWSDGDVETDDEPEPVEAEPTRPAPKIEKSEPVEGEAAPPQAKFETASTTPLPPSQPRPPRPPQEQLWTSKDRSKYKKQQQRLRHEAEKRRRRQLQSPPIHPNSSDDDMTDDGETEGDGLGYSLPNLPVYYTDDEGGTTTDGFEIEPPTRTTPHQQQQPPPPQQQKQQHAYSYPNAPYPYPEQAATQSPYVGYAPPGAYPMTYPYGAYTPQQQQQQQQLYAAQQHAAAWAASVGTGPAYGPPHLYPPWSRSSYHQVPSTMNKNAPQVQVPVQRQKPDNNRVPAVEATRDEASFPVVASVPMDPTMPIENNVVSLAEAGSMINFDSLQKISILMVGIALLCYCAVSPRMLELVDYNKGFKENLCIVALAFIAPIVNALCVFDVRMNDINDVVSIFYTSFTAGYSFAFVLEIILTTVLRLGVFLLWEPKIFDLTPKVPALVLPWVLRENKYRPKRITLFVADFVTSCVAAPIVEEYIKLKILQLSVKLPKNFKWTKKKPGKKGRKKRLIAEPIVRGPGEQEVVNINSYVTKMLAASLGIKLCDTIRRILMYTKESDQNKGFYAFCRGVFPIHELCGTMTALSLAKRDVLGMEIPLWRMLAPAVVIHGMANFRGMKPLFKWNSATPWSEMQLSPWNVADDSTFSQLLNKGFAKLMWLIVLGRVLGYCIKNYYLISRQANKRVTTYAGKHSAFSAELTAAEMLKKTKEK